MPPKRTLPLVFDGHNDTLLDLFEQKAPRERSFFSRSSHGHIDLPRAREGGFGGGFFAIFVPNRYGRGHPRPQMTTTPEGYAMTLPDALDPRYALQVTVGMAGLLFQLERESEGALKVVRSAAEIEACLRKNVIAAILHVEGADFVDPGFHALDLMAEAGLKSLGLVWSRPTAFATGVPFSFPASPDQGPGLTELGRELVKHCNQRRILVDLSHLNEAGFWDVARISDAPLVATHSGAHALSASPRNLTDKQLRAIAQTGGMVGVNFHKGFLREDGNEKRKTGVDEIVRHVLYMAELIGIDHVGLGSDFDGADMPEELGDVSGLPRLLNALKAAGLDESALRKVAHENWVRVLRLVWGN